MDPRRKRIVLISAACVAAALCALGVFLAWYLACPHSPGYLRRAQAGASLTASTATKQHSGRYTSQTAISTAPSTLGGPESPKKSASPASNTTSVYAQLSSIAGSIKRTGSSAVTTFGQKIAHVVGSESPKKVPGSSYVPKVPRGIMSTPDRKALRRKTLHFSIDENRNTDHYDTTPHTAAEDDDDTLPMQTNTRSMSIFDDDESSGDEMAVDAPKGRQGESVLRRNTSSIEGVSLDGDVLAGLMSYLSIAGRDAQRTSIPGTESARRMESFGAQPLKNKVT